MNLPALKTQLLEKLLSNLHTIRDKIVYQDISRYMPILTNNERIVSILQKIDERLPSTDEESVSVTDGFIRQLLEEASEIQTEIQEKLFVKAEEARADLNEFSIQRQLKMYLLKGKHSEIE